MKWLIPAFLVSGVVSLLLTHRVRKWASRAGIVDVPDGGRHSHLEPVPRCGGLAIYLTFLLVILLGVAASVPYLVSGDNALRALVVGGTVIVALGLIDDVRGLQPHTKLIVQLLVALFVFAFGVRIESVGLPNGELLRFPLWVSGLVTVIWIIGITNAFNLIDGADGVAAGAALFAAASMAMVFAVTGETMGAFIALVLAAAALGFLFFNFPPASVFLGDSGSLFLGFTLSTLGVITAQKAPTLLAVAIPVVSCGLPVLDTGLTIVRRFLRRDPLFNADRGHIHHRLRDLGHSPRKVTLLLYVASAGFAFFSLIIVQPSGPLMATAFVTVGAVVWLLFQKLRIPEVLEFHRILHRGLNQRSVIANNLRVREAAMRLRNAQSGTDVLNALEYVLSLGEFEKAEIWLHESLARLLRETHQIDSQPGGSVWRWSKHPAGESALREAIWELRLPFRDEEGDVIGRLDMWRSTANSQLLADMQLIAVELQPELQRAFKRLIQQANARPARQQAPEAPSIRLPIGRAHKPSPGLLS